MNPRRSLVAFVMVCLVVSGSMAATASGPVELFIVHQNDFHGRLEPIVVDDEIRGGIAHLAGMVQAIRALYPDQVLWLDGGDTWHGTTLANAFLGESVVDAFNAAGLDAMALGNHEFNYDQAELVARAAQANFPVLSANTIQSDGGTPLLSPYALFERAGLTVAVIGLTTPDTEWAAHPKHTQGIHFDDPVETAQRLVQELEAKADVIIAVTHLGLEQDQRLARDVPQIDVIVGGHSHTKLESPVLIGDTVIVQANEYGKYLGVLRLVVDGGKVVEHEGRLVPVTEDTPVHLGVVAQLDEWNAKLSDRFEALLGHNSVFLDGEWPDVRIRQTNLGTLVAKLMRESLGADVGFVNSGSIRTSIAPGPVRMQDAYNVLPFENRLVGIELSGSALLDALEHGVQGYPQPWGGFPQVAGISFEFDPERPAGERVLDVRVNGEPLDFDRTYTVATSDFLAAGGDGYTVFASAKPMGTGNADGPFLRDLLVEYFLSGVEEPALTK